MLAAAVRDAFLIFLIPRLRQVVPHDSVAPCCCARKQDKGDLEQPDLKQLGAYHAALPVGGFLSRHVPNNGRARGGEEKGKQRLSNFNCKYILHGTEKVACRGKATKRLRFRHRNESIFSAIDDAKGAGRGQVRVRGRIAGSKVRVQSSILVHGRYVSCCSSQCEFPARPAETTGPAEKEREFGPDALHQNLRLCHDIIPLTGWGDLIRADVDARAMRDLLKFE